MLAVDSVGKDALEARFVEAYEQSRPSVTNGVAEAFSVLREEAFGSFVASGFPAVKDEAWKYTNVRRKLAHPFRVSEGPALEELTEADLRPFLIDGFDADRIVLIDGRLIDSLCNVAGEGVQVLDLKDAAQQEGFRRHLGEYARPEKDSFIALNTAFVGHGVALHQKRVSAAPRPIHIINISSRGDRMTLPRILVTVESGAEMTIVETFHSSGTGPVFVNSVVEAFVGAGGRMDYYRLQDAGSHFSAVNNAYFYQEESSHASCTTITLSGDLIRNNVVMLPDGEHCESHLFGLFLGKGALHVDNHTLVDHAKPDCFSNELYKGVLDDASTGVFNGRVLVRRDAQKTNAYQSNKSIVLSDAATMNAKPELEIYADDVKCSHGATTGRLDAEALFYLRSRGLTEQQSRRMLLLAFVRDVIESIRPEDLRSYVDRLLEDRMGATPPG